ncbi:MAG: sodium:solute symporter [Ignavibacteria bacterium]|nr:sodium:solute symporter [Ignavibacteria bacterium]
MHFTVVDIIIVIVYLGGIALFGALSGGKQRSARDYFLSESAVPWWAVTLAIVATETSALTFLSIPGIAYAADLSFLQLAIGYIIGRILVARLLLPRYFQGELSTAYAYLGTRFGMRMRRTASTVFMTTRVFADGVRLYTTAIPLALLLKGFGVLPGTSDTTVYLVAIGVLSLLTLVYVYFGGVRAVIWTDVIQFFIYIGGAMLALYYLQDLLGERMAEGFASLTQAGKLHIFSSGFDLGWAGFFAKPYTTLASIAGGVFLSMASHGTDQLIIQRVLTTGDLRKSQRAMIVSGIIVFAQFAMFLVLGSLLWIFYQGQPHAANEVFATFLLEQLPSGVTGLIVAGILAAAMSTLSGSISALGSATMMDIVLPLRRTPLADAVVLRWSRLFSMGWCLVLIASASLFIQTPKAVVELALSIASYTYGGLLGVFLLGVLFRAVGETAAIIGFAAAIATMACVILLTPVAWTWYVLIGSSACIASALLASVFLPSPPIAEHHGIH